MKRLILLATIIGMFTACDKDDKNTPVYTPPAGVADITLTTTEGQEYKLAGPCGWAFAGGVGYIGANHAANSARTFSVDTNLTVLPSETTTYTLTSEVSDENPNKIRMHILEYTSPTTYISWDSYIGSGTLTLVVEGNKVTADLSGITLAAADVNASPYNHNGNLSGTLKFYK